MCGSVCGVGEGVDGGCATPRDLFDSSINDGLIMDLLYLKGTDIFFLRRTMYHRFFFSEAGTTLYSCLFYAEKFLASF